MNLSSAKLSREGGSRTLYVASSSTRPDLVLFFCPSPAVNTATSRRGFRAEESPITYASASVLPDCSCAPALDHRAMSFSSALGQKAAELQSMRDAVVQQLEVQVYSISLFILEMTHDTVYILTSSFEPSLTLHSLCFEGFGKCTNVP